MIAFSPHSKALLIFTLLLFSVWNVSSISTVKFAMNLREKLEHDIDTNFLFYRQVKEQRNNPYICSSDDGPECKFVGGRTLEEYVERRDEAVERKKSDVIAYMDKVYKEMDEQRGNERDYFVVFTNDHRDTLLGYKVKAKDSFDVQIYLNFEDHPLEPADTEIKDLYSMNYQGSAFKGSFIQSKTVLSDQAVQLHYSGVYLPAHEKVYSKYNQKEADSDKQNNEKSNLAPYGVYIYTHETAPGEIKFSKPVRISQFHVRKHNFGAYKKSLSDSEKNLNLVEHKAKGYLKGALVQEFEIQSHMTTNRWLKVKVEKPQEIDKLMLDPNEEVDNLIFDLTHSNSAKEAKSLGEIKLIGNIGQIESTIELKIEDGGLVILKDGIVQYKAGVDTDDEDAELLKQIAALFMESEDQKDFALTESKKMLNTHRDDQKESEKDKKQKSKKTSGTK